MKLESFPYIQALQINDCYAIKDTHIQVFEKGEEFRHLILTGKNGSGKTTVLKEINALYLELKGANNRQEQINILRKNLIQQPNNPIAKKWKEHLYRLTKIEVQNDSDLTLTLTLIQNKSEKHVYSFFEAQRLISVQDVSSPIKEQDIINHLYKGQHIQQISESYKYTRFSQFFKYYLVNKKIEQAFEIIDNKPENKEKIQQFFNDLEMLFQDIFEDKTLKFIFIREDYNFKIVHSDGREVNFNQLSSGFSALLDIISELIVQIDLIRKSVNDYTYDPLGIVLIDEPENHAHLKMQEKVLPLLTKLFPRVQFIVATHSPAVIASIKNATVFDLSSKETFREGLVGSSYSQLMIKLFGLNNQYSTLADQLLNKVNTLLLEENKEKAKTELQKILTENVDLLSPSLYLEIESAIHLIQD